MAKRTTKVGITGKYGTRYGASLRKQAKRFEITQHSRYGCIQVHPPPQRCDRRCDDSENSERTTRTERELKALGEVWALNDGMASR
ncbi:hypothetical protein CIB48_g8612 [Xylaria polymorpha]|nr:hypothetical protein CIB48_g8612 [Xylaria polymorpha]